MTVRELVLALADMDPDAVVVTDRCWARVLDLLPLDRGSMRIPKTYKGESLVVLLSFSDQHSKEKSR